MANLIGEAQRTATARARALKGVALSAVSLAMVAPGFAQAQQQPAGEVQEITITGSHIKAPNLTSDSPVSAVSQEEIRQTNVQSVENLLNQLPAVTAAVTTTQSSFTVDTTASINLRNLGQTRTLVLIDGKRIGPGDPQTVNGASADVNFIPISLVKGVDVLTGGASAIYGSDAIAGVVNFHLDRNFEGVKVDYSFSAYDHSNGNSFARSVQAGSLYHVDPAPNSTFDGFTRESSGVVGSNSADGKGNVTLYADYRSIQPVSNSSRDTQGCPNTTTTNNGKITYTCGGSATNTHGYFILPGVNNGKAVSVAADGTLVPFSNAFRYNYASTTFLQRQDDRATLGALSHYEINEHFDVYADMMFMRDSSHQQESPSGLFAGGQPGVQTTLTIPCSNLSTKVGSLGVSVYQAVGCTSPTGSATIGYPGLRFAFPREDTVTHNDYRAVAGVRGDIDGNWAYDVSVSHWNVDFGRTDTNFVGRLNVDAAETAGTFNVFAPTTAGENAGLLLGEVQGNTFEDDVQINVSGDLGPYGGKSPLASNPVAVAAGLEYRHTGLTLTPDGNEQAGNLGGENPILGTTGGEQVKELYGELRIPVIENMYLAKTFDINLALRHSDYTVDNSASEFSTNTYKVDFDYAPVNDIRFRGGYNRAARAPNVFELFQPAQYNLATGFNDPCATGTASLAACTNPAIGRAAVTAAQYGNVAGCPAQQCNTYIGGNLDLKPEKADTWTWGFNFTPEFAPGLSASVDYWDVKINDYINTLSPAQIVTGCYSGITYYCQFIQRDATAGSPYQGSLIGNGRIFTLNRNLASLHTDGIDFDVDYRKNLGDLTPSLDGLGAIDVRLIGTYLMKENTQSSDLNQSYDCSGQFGATCNTGPQSVWRHTMRVTWATPWNADFAVIWRHYSSVTFDGNNPKMPDYLVTSGLFDGPDNKIPSYDYIDLQASYTLYDKYTIRLGVNNLMDKDPPFLSGAATGTQNQGANGNTFTQYDALGRMLFMAVSAKF